MVDHELASHEQPLNDDARKWIRELGTHGSRTVVSTTLPTLRASAPHGTGGAQRQSVPDSYFEAELNRQNGYDPQFIQMQLRDLRANPDLILR